jgi:di/tricarboxylate transporter
MGLLIFLVLAMIDPAAVHIAALTAALLVVVGGALTAREAYASMDWDVLFLLGGTLALGSAVASCGLAERMATSIVDNCGGSGEALTIAIIFLFTALLTQILSNIAAAAIMTPLAYATGIEMGQTSPMALVMAVAFGASCCFLTPVGYQTNLLVYGPGGYRFTDFLRIGLPLTLMFSVLATWLLPLLY